MTATPARPYIRRWGFATVKAGDDVSSRGLPQSVLFRLESVERGETDAASSPSAPAGRAHALALTLVAEDAPVDGSGGRPAWVSTFTVGELADMAVRTWLGAGVGTHVVCLAKPERALSLARGPGPHTTRDS